MYKSKKWLIGIGSFFTLIVLSAPICFYVIDFHNLPRSSDPSDWGTFGDYFGGILNPIISFLTLIVTVIIAISISKIERRNHEESVHNAVLPFFTINADEFYSSDISLNGLSVEMDYYDYNPPKEPANTYDYLSKRFYLKVYNKGLGIATQVHVLFEVNVDALIQLLSIDDEKIKVTVEKTEDEAGRIFVIISINSEYYNYFGSFKIFERNHIRLGVIDIGYEEKIDIPGQIINAFQLFNLIRRIKNINSNFPLFSISFSYKNIHGRSLYSKFRISLIHVNDFKYYSSFIILPSDVAT